MAWLAPSILSADFTNLAAEVRMMEEAGVEILHFDVMDGHFVPNLTVGLPVLSALREKSGLILDVHLMISNPDEMAERYAQAGADYVTVHYETSRHLDRLIEAIREAGAEPGVALNPHTPVQVLEEILSKCHHVLIMSVNPGFGGQKFIARSLQKVRKLREMIDSQQAEVKIEIDGGVCAQNVADVARSGVEILVAGSAIFGSDAPPRAFRDLQEMANQATSIGQHNAVSV